VALSVRAVGVACTLIAAVLLVSAAVLTMNGVRVPSLTMTGAVFAVVGFLLRRL
jgi:uncharacterized membrane protein